MLKSIIVGTLFTMIAAATDYHVGPGQPMAQIGQVPWYQLQAGDTVYIHYQPTPYYEKFQISSRGTSTQWIRVLGVPGPNGELPILSGNNATTSTSNHFRWQTLDANGVQWDGVVQISLRSDDPVLGPAPLPGYIEIANLQVQDANSSNSFTGENGAKAKYDEFASCIYARSAQHILIRNNVMTNCGLGFYNWTGSSANVWWDGLEIDTVLRANYFYNNGVVNSYSEHQSYTESDGVIIEYNHYGPPRSGMLGSQIKDRSAGSVIRYNYIEMSPAGWVIDMVEPENGWDGLGTKSTYAQDFVYGNIMTNLNNIEPNMVHWNEDHNMGIGRATIAGGRLHFYDNSVITIGDGANMWHYSFFNETWGGFDCPTAKLPGVIELRNNILATMPRTPGSDIAPLTLAYCGKVNFDLGLNWISPGWNTSGGVVTGGASMFTPPINDPGFANVAGGDLHLLPGSSAAGIGQALPAAIANNVLGLDLTPNQQYVYNMQVTARPSGGGAGSAAGAFDAGGVPAGCNYTISPPSNSYAAGAATGTLSVTTGTTCGWSASSPTSWLTITSGSSGTGYGLVNYGVSANTSTSSRTGSLMVAGTPVSITQAGATCQYSLSATNGSFAAAGGSGSVGVTGGTGCAWTGVSNSSWISVTGGASGSGNGTVSYTVAANSATSSRSGTMTIGGQTFTVSEAAAAATVCSYTLSATSASITAGGGPGSLTVTGGTGCAWTAVSNNKGWLTITSGASGSGNGTVNYSAAANATTSSRSGTMTIGGQTFTVSEAAPAPACAYTISPTSASVLAAGGSGSITVTGGTGCAWTGVSNNAWITVTAGASGSGKGTVSYSVAANAASTLRSGTITIGGQTFTVSEGALAAVAICTYAVSPTSIAATAAGGSASITVTAPAGCAWSASSGVAWIVSSALTGSGNGTIPLSVAPLGTAASRTGTIALGSNTVTVTQNAATATGGTTVKFQDGTNSYTGAVDRTISSMYASESWNGGVGVTDPSGTTLELKNDSEYEARALLRFSGLNIPAGATITSATLTVTFTDWLDTPMTVNGYYLAAPWNATAKQAGLNWADRDASTVWAQPGAKGAGTDVIANKTFSIAGFQASGNQAKTVNLDPAVVQGWITNPASNQGVVLTLNPQTTLASMTAFSTEAANISQRPVLTITYK